MPEECVTGGVVLEASHCPVDGAAGENGDGIVLRQPPFQTLYLFGKLLVTEAEEIGDMVDDADGGRHGI
jgi:hypothetical protein